MSSGIIIKKQSKLAIIEEVARFFEGQYPDYYQFCLREIPKLRGVSTAGYTDKNGNYTYVHMKLPSMMWLCLQYVMRCRGYEKFGQTPEDVQLVTKCWKNLDAHIPMEKERESLYIPKDVYTTIFGDAADVENEEEDQPKEEAAGEETKSRILIPDHCQSRRPPQAPQGLGLVGDDPEDRHSEECGPC
jgi:hypothetical protein